MLKDIELSVNVGATGTTVEILNVPTVGADDKESTG